MLEEKKTEFKNKITSKIKYILIFGTIIEIIDINHTQDKNKKVDYYNILKTI